MIYFEKIHDEKPLALGYICYIKIKEETFEKDPNNYITNNKVNLDLIKKICNSLNNGIKSFQLISEEFKEFYKKEEEEFKKEKIHKKLKENEDQKEIKIDIENMDK